VSHLSLTHTHTHSLSLSHTRSPSLGPSRYEACSTRRLLGLSLLALFPSGCFMGFTTSLLLAINSSLPSFFHSFCSFPAAPPHPPPNPQHPPTPPPLDAPSLATFPSTVNWTRVREHRRLAQEAGDGDVFDFQLLATPRALRGGQDRIFMTIRRPTRNYKRAYAIRGSFVRSRSLCFPQCRN
jgi:hypothetical protein